MSKSRIIITDPHGCYDTLMALIAKLPSGVPVTFAGDLIDRGPDSRKIIEFIGDGGYDCVQGNHEDMMLRDLHFRVKENGEEQIFVDWYHSDWMYNGGQRCLDSYLVPKKEELATGEIIETMVHDITALKRDTEWLRSLPVYIRYPELVNDKGQELMVSHSTAGDIWDMDHANPQFKTRIMWDRDPFPPKIDGIYNVYGHTPQKNGPTVKEHFAAIDGGCYFKRQPYGKLYALQFPEMTVYEQDNVEKEPK